MVFVTRYRRGVFDDAMLASCEDAMRKVCAAVGADLAEFTSRVNRFAVRGHFWSPS